MSKEMTPGPELFNRQIDVLVAEKVMGITKENPDEYGDEQWNDNGVIFRRLPAYSTDIAAAWEVVERMRSYWHYEFFLAYDVYWEASFSHVQKGTFYKQEKLDTAPLAICLAALKAVGVEI